MLRSIQRMAPLIVRKDLCRHTRGIVLNHQWRMQSSHSSHSAGVSGRNVLSEMLLYSPLQVSTCFENVVIGCASLRFLICFEVVAGLALGGLGATVAAIVYFLHSNEVLENKSSYSHSINYVQDP